MKNRSAQQSALGAKRRRVLHLISGLWVGGAETILLRLLPLMQSDIENHVCCVRGRGPIGPQLEAAGVSVHYLDLAWIGDLRIITRFWSVIREVKPDILVTHLIHADLYGRVFGRLFGIRRVICSQHGSLLQWEWLRSFDRWTASFVTRYVVQTHVARAEIAAKLHIPTSRFAIIPNMFDTQSVLPRSSQTNAWLRKEFAIPRNARVIVCVSNLRRLKGHEVLIEAFDTVAAQHHDVHLLIVGDGERRLALEEQVRLSSAGSRIHFAGHRSDVPRILAGSTAYVLPTFAEGMSTAILEAMGNALPIVTTSIPVNAEVIRDGENGLLVPAGDASELATALHRVLADTALAIKLGQAARTSVEDQYDSRVVAHQWLTLLSQL